MKKNRKLRRADSPFNFILTFGTLLLGILFVWIMKLEMDTQIETGLKTYLQQQQLDLTSYMKRMEKSRGA